jgi:hypothetical protein
MQLLLSCVWIGAALEYRHLVLFKRMLKKHANLALVGLLPILRLSTNMEDTRYYDIPGERLGLSAYRFSPDCNLRLATGRNCEYLGHGSCGRSRRVCTRNESLLFGDQLFAGCCESVSPETFGILADASWKHMPRDVLSSFLDVISNDEAEWNMLGEICAAYIS